MMVAIVVAGGWRTGLFRRSRQTSSVSEQARELKVGEDNALLSSLLFEPGRGPALADSTMQINATDNMFLLPEQANRAAARARSPHKVTCAVL